MTIVTSESIKAISADKVRMDRMMLAITSGLVSKSTGWVALPRYPDYFVGDAGEVVSVKRQKPLLMSPTSLGEYDGYVLWGVDGKPHHEYRHLLVAETVHGPRPKGLECRHKDSNRKNAHYSNLAWSTHLENERDKIANGTNPVGERHGGAKLMDADVLEMRRIRLRNGVPYYQIAEHFKVSTMTAFRAITGKSWSHLK